MTAAQLATFGEPGMRALRDGLAAQQVGRNAVAIAAYRRALQQHPGLAPAHFNLGQLLRDQGDYVGAAICFEGAARLRPSAVDAWLNLGAMLERLDRYRDAVAAYERATAVGSDDPTPQMHRGSALLALGDFGEAAAAFRAVLEVRPDDLNAQVSLAIALLAVGKLAAGWQQYESRWARQGVDPSSRFRGPLWQGEPVAGKRILVWREQGLGEELLFATCLRELVAGGAEVTLAASPGLVSLFQRAFPSVAVVAEGKLKPGTFDWHVPIGGLPRYLRRSRTDFPSSSKYLVPDSSHATRWSNRLDRLGPEPKVGLCWRGAPAGADPLAAGSVLDAWRPLLTLPNIHWISLQTDEGGSELARAEKAFEVTVHRWRGENLTADLESAVGLVWNLDAVVTMPPAIAALAGGVGIPTWQIEAAGDWTAHGEARLPWFPATQVVRRPAGAAEWAMTIERIASDLQRTFTGGAR